MFIDNEAARYIQEPIHERKIFRSLQSLALDVSIDSINISPLRGCRANAKQYLAERTKF
jgi:hypothetical protein